MGKETNSVLTTDVKEHPKKADDNNEYNNACSKIVLSA
jgi:hypothetical protein